MSASSTRALAEISGTEPVVDAREPVQLLQRDLRTGPAGLSSREAARRLQVVGPNALSVRRRRRMATVDQIDGAITVHVKGAPEDILPRCWDVNDAERVAALTMVDDMADHGLRVLAVADRSWPPGLLPDREEAESDLRLVGLVGLIDPPRPEVAAAVTACHTAGIRVHVVTGDNGRTAAEIARAVGIGADRVVDGLALDAMAESDLDALLTSGQEVVFARAAPEAKLRIADALQDCGEVVAMTGDGVNDAPALHRADMGTETLPAPALGREPAEPGLMSRPPRRRENVIDRRLLLRAWGIMGLVAAALVLAAFFVVLLRAGWHWGADVSEGSPLHRAYLQATTASFAGIVACQLGAAVASRAEYASLRSIGFLGNRLLLGSMVFEVIFAAAVIYLPALQTVFGTAGLPLWVILMMLPFPVLVSFADEFYRWVGRRWSGPGPRVPKSLSARAVR